MIIAAIVAATAPAIASKNPPWGQRTGFRATGERQDIKRCDAATVKRGTLALPGATLGVIGRTITIRSKTRQLIVESRHIAALVGIDPGIKDMQPLHMQIAPGIVVDGNIGKDFLDQWNVTLDPAGSRAWLAPADRGNQCVPS